MDRHEILIVGAGPAGMSAAVELRALNFSPLVIDEQSLPGGQIWRARESERPATVLAALGADYDSGADNIARFRSSGAEYSPETRMWSLEPGFRAYMSRHGQAFSAEFRAVLLATGAQERPVPMPGWTLPGVLTVGAAQILLKSSAQIPESPVWIAGSGPLPILYMRQLLALGGRIAGYLETTPAGGSWRMLPHLVGAARGHKDVRKGLKWLNALKASGLQIHRGVRDLRAIGHDRLEGITYRTKDGRSHSERASILLLHEGIVPSVHASMSLGCEHEWREAQGCFVPMVDQWGMTSVDGLYVAGDGAGIAGAAAAVARGRIAAQGIAQRLGRPAPPTSVGEARLELDRAIAPRGFIDALYPPPDKLTNLPDDTIVCRCEELTAGEIRAAAKIHRGGPNQIKSYTRCGMGPCQGRQCGYTVNSILSREYGQTPAETGFFRIRPPLKPVTLGELAALEEISEAR